MKLYFLQVISLLGIDQFAQGNPNPPPHGVRTYTHNGAFTTRGVPLESPIEAFRAREECREDLFNPNGSHSPEIFAAITSENHAMALTNCVQELYEYSNALPRSLSKPSVLARVRAINQQDVSMCRTNECCGFLRTFIHVLSKDALKKMNRSVSFTMHVKWELAEVPL